jgi:nucleotide-binding universal stress UspA family protein
MVKRILVGLGGTPFTPTAIRYGTELAKAHQAEIDGVTVIDYRRLHAFEKSGSARDAVREYREIEQTKTAQEASIRQFDETCAKVGLPWSVVRESGDPFAKMISLARYHDLMLFGLRSLFDYGLATNASDALTQLVSRGVRPILAVSQAYRPIRRVLLGYSGSMESARAIKQFLHMQLWKDLTLKVVTFEHSSEVARTLLSDVAGYCQSYGYQPETEHVEGSPKQQLLQHATDWNADLIVLGNSAKHVWVKKFLGETAMNVIRHANIPLFLSQ